MNIYLLRHAIAVERGTKGYTDDSKRPLTSEGQNKMRRNALGIKAMGLSFDLILSSPYLRAKQTAEIIIKLYKTKNKFILTKNLIPEALFKDLVNEINALDQKDANILLVGHEPHMSGFISFLLRGDKTIHIDLKKGGLCHLTTTSPLKAECATLKSLLTPAQLQLMTK